MSRVVLLAVLLLAACSSPETADGFDSPDASQTEDDAAVQQEITPDASAQLNDGGHNACSDCVTNDDCPNGGSCVQYGGNDYCAWPCGAAGCGPDGRCESMVDGEGNTVSVCIPKTASCPPDPGCGNGCPTGQTCEIASGSCVAEGIDAGPDEIDPDGGTPDVGKGADAGPKVGVTANGGYVNRLRFAVVGDTRPPQIDATAKYPSTIIKRIFSDIEALSPRPPFVLTTGDYMWATPSGPEGAKQMALYEAAMPKYSGVLFATLGNHDCSGGLKGNCATNHTKNYNAWFDSLVKPLGRVNPYYKFRVDAVDGTWTAKFLNIACNAWSTAQKNWLDNELSNKTTYTFVWRHEGRGITDAPCVTEADAIIAKHPLTLLIVGHAHIFTYGNKQLIVGNGGAPLTGKAGYGFAVVEQKTNGDIQIKQYDYMNTQPVKVYAVP